MTKDTNEKNDQFSSFREQILRDLEEMKSKRLTTQEESSVLSSSEDITTIHDEIEGPTESIPPVQDSVEMEPVDKIEESSISAGDHEESTFAVEKETASTSVHQDTVEKNLAELRRLVAGNARAVEETPTYASRLDLMGETVFSFDEPVAQEEPVLEFPQEDLSSVTGDTEVLVLEKTLVASQASVGETAVQQTQVSSLKRPHSSYRKSKRNRNKQDKVVKRIVSVIVSVVAIAVLVTGIAGYLWVNASLSPVDAQSTQEIQVEIPQGSTTLDIGKILVEKKLIKNATVFNYYSKIKSYNNYQSGFYNLKQNMSVDDIAKALQESGTPAAQKEPAGKVLIVEGYTLKQIAQAVTDNMKTEDKNDKTPFTAEQFMETVNNEDFINRMVAAYPNLLGSLPAADSGVIHRLEGYLFPAVYEYTEDTTMEQLIEQMLMAMDARLQPHYAAIAAKNLTVNEVLTLASLVEKEGSTDEDRRNIASVFFNRINAGMPLQSNIAILYAQGKLGEETTLAEDAAIDTAIDSPYNIYWKTGLMPGPVDSSGLSAIEAVVNANTTDYLYFVADVTTGKVYYATTIEEHDQNVAQYVNAHLE